VIPSSPIRAAVVVASDRCARGDAVDASGPAVADVLRNRLHAIVVETRCLPDDRADLSAAFRELAHPDRAIDLVASTGGTGLAPRDVVPEAARDVIEREHEGLMDLARLRCLERTPLAFLSRGVAGTVGSTLIVTLPGSPRGAVEMLEAVADVLPHAIEMLRGESNPVADQGRHGA